LYKASCSSAKRAALASGLAAPPAPYDKTSGVFASSCSKTFRFFFMNLMLEVTNTTLQIVIIQ
jgi:hypothetical protein